MKKLSLLFLTVLTISSCSDNLQFTEETQQELVLKQVNYVAIENPDNCEGRFAFFDTQGKITETYYECNGATTSPRIYNYHDSGLIHWFSGYLDFEYDENNNLIRRSGGNDTGSSYHEYYYNNNIMYTQSYYNGVLSSRYYSYEFEDNTYKKLLSSKFIEANGTDEEIISRTTYTYDGNNPIEILIERKDEQDVNSVLEPIVRHTYTYDDRVNPYQLGLPDNAYIASSMVLAYVEGLANVGSVVYSADNNVIGLTVNNFELNTTNTKMYTYSYNDDMYPVEALVSFNGEQFRRELFEYYE